MNIQNLEFEPLPFEIWLSQQEGDFEEVTCKECDGNGTVECECDCGHEHEKECESCEGEGAISGAIEAYWKRRAGFRLRSGERRAISGAIEAYWKQVKIDRKRWEHFIQSTSPAI